MYKKFILVLALLLITVFIGGWAIQYPSRILQTPSGIYAYLDTAKALNFGDSAYFRIPLFSGNDFSDGQLTIGIRPDTASTAHQLGGGSDSLYVLYRGGHGVSTYNSAIDTIIFTSENVVSGKGLDWTAESWYYGYIGGTKNSLQQSEWLEIQVYQEDCEDTTDVIIRVEWRR
jgi:hypothetical protein